jgi:hypothetical protein
VKAEVLVPRETSQGSLWTDMGSSKPIEEDTTPDSSGSDVPVQSMCGSVKEWVRRP